MIDSDSPWQVCVQVVSSWADSKAWLPAGGRAWALWMKVRGVCVRAVWCWAVFVRSEEEYRLSETTLLLELLAFDACWGSLWCWVGGPVTAVEHFLTLWRCWMMLWADPLLVFSPRLQILRPSAVPVCAEALMFQNHEELLSSSALFPCDWCPAWDLPWIWALSGCPALHHWW